MGAWMLPTYVDIKKAFDRVPHKRLLWNLKHIGGLKGKVLEWMRDYLKDREMRTVIREAVVQWNRLRSGGLGIPECIGSNTDYGLSGDWASTRDNGPQLGGLSDWRSALGGLL